MTNNDVTSTTTHMYRYFTVYLYVNNIENSIDTCGYKAFPLSLDIGNGSCCHCQQSVTCSEDWEKGSEEREKRIPLSLVPRLFRTQALSRRGKSLATLGGQGRLLPLRHDSWDLQRPHPTSYFANYHVIFAITCTLFSKRFSGEKSNTKP